VTPLVEFIIGVLFGAAVVSIVVVPILLALKYWLGDWDDADDEFSRRRLRGVRPRIDRRYYRARVDDE
jgi:hypothetical protein